MFIFLYSFVKKSRCICKLPVVLLLSSYLKKSFFSLVEKLVALEGWYKYWPCFNERSLFPGADCFRLHLALSARRIQRSLQWCVKVVVDYIFSPSFRYKGEIRRFSYLIIFFYIVSNCRGFNHFSMI